MAWFWSGVRQVATGPYPLYRLLILGILIACVLQLWLGVPASVAIVASVKLDWVFWSFQFCGAMLVLASFYIRRAALSLQIERAGAIALATSGLMYFAAALAVIGTVVPVSGAIWGSLLFTIYLLRRVFWEIPHHLREVREAAKTLLDRGDG